MQIDTLTEDINERLLAWARWHPISINTKLYYPNQTTTRRLYSVPGEQADKLSGVYFDDSELAALDRVIAKMLVTKGFAHDAEIIVLHYREGVRCVKLANIYGVHRSTVYDWLDIARQKIIELLIKQEA